MIKQEQYLLYIYNQDPEMINLPDLDKLQTNTSYTDIFRDTMLWNIGIYGMGAFAIFIIFLIIKLVQLKKQNKIQRNRQSLLTNNRQSQEDEQAPNRESAIVIADSTTSITQQQQKQSNKVRAFDLINRVTSVAFYLTLISVAAIFLGYYAFGQLGHGTGHDVFAIIITIAIILLPTLIWKKSTIGRNKKISKEQIVFAGVMIFLWIGISIFAVIALKGVCICVFNDKYGFKIDKDFVFSTEFTRSLQIEKVCKDGQVCHIYTTLPENGSDSVFINLHTGTNINNLSISLIESNNTFTKVSKAPFKLHDIEYIAQRNVFSFFFDGLKPDTLYSVVVKNIDNDAILDTKKYRTLPNQNADELRLAVGGDVGLDDAANKLTSYLKQFNPHAIILGGDNAYDDGMRTCYYSWDNLYDIMNELNTQLNRLVPLILTIGNHDVGFNALAEVKIDMADTENLPYYFIYNPQHKSLGSSEIPIPKDRRSFHYHILGPTVHVHLDSGYIERFDTQRLLIDKVVSNFPSHFKFANYHNPIYPSCTDSTQGSNDWLVINQGLKSWTPLFDSGKFTAAFEHHTHHRKFTKKIIGNKVVNRTDVGVRYVGDGSWGVPEDACPAGHETKQPQYFEYYEKENANHVWKIKIVRKDTNYTIQYVAIDGKNITVFNATDNL